MATTFFHLATEKIIPVASWRLSKKVNFGPWGLGNFKKILHRKWKNTSKCFLLGKSRVWISKTFLHMLSSTLIILHNLNWVKISCPRIPLPSPPPPQKSNGLLRSLMSLLFPRQLSSHPMRIVNELTAEYRRGVLMVSALDSRASAPCSSPSRGHCVVFLGKTLNSHGASLHPGV